MAQILDGLKISKEIKTEIRYDVEKIVEGKRRPPHLVAILVGQNGASIAYVNNKIKDCREVGFKSSLVKFPSTVSEAELLEKINELNLSKDVDGFIVQLPLPPQIDAQRVIAAIDPEKDVDGFHPINAGRLATGLEAMVPCTPLGCLYLLNQELGPISGKNAVVIGRSNIVGKPMALLLLGESATVTIAHSRTRDLPDVVRRADIVVAAVGRPEMVRGDWIKPGAVVIDVGINRVPAAEEGKTRLVGDVAYDEAAHVASAVTPVPGGVGPMTIAMLLRNTVVAAHRRAGLEDPEGL